MKKGKKLYVMLISAVCCSLMIGTLLPIFAEDLQEDMVEEVSVPEQSSNETPKKEDITYENVAEVTEQEKEVIVADSQQKQLNEISKGSIDVWDGTSSDTSWYNESQSQFILTTANQLNGLAQLIKSGKKMDGKIFQLGNDIYLNSDENPTANKSFMIGDKKYFNGTFDGQNYTVHNVYIKESSRQYVGFFAYTWGEEPVKNLTITGSITGGENTGMVAIANPNAKISYCTNKANITGTNNVAGIVSYKVANISHCINNGKITGTGQTGGIISNAQNTIIENCSNIGDIKGGGCTGGILGYSADYLTVKDCNNNANVSGGYDTGGIVGKAEWASSISGCQQQGDVYAFGTSGGGIIGTSYGTIEDCINKGGTVDAYWGKTGGIVGYLSTDGSIANCQNSAIVQGDSGNNTSSGNNGGIGGIVGYAEKVNAVKSCKNSGKIEAKMENAGGIIGTAKKVNLLQDCTNSGEVSAINQNSGGVIGSLTNDSSNQTIIKSCINSGRIGTANSHHNAGIVGYGFYMDITNSQNSGKIKGWAVVGGIVAFSAYTVNIQNTDNTGDVIGVADTGGIVGYSFQAAQNGKLSLTSCENTGTISSRRYLGGIVGRSNGEDHYLKCINKGTVIETLTPAGEDQYNDQKIVGGIVGYTMTNSTIIEECQNTGTITGDGNWIGGVVGSNVAELKNCQNTGNIKITEISSLNDAEYMQIGGIVGWNKANLTKCINEGTINVVGKADAHLTDSVYVNYNIGGISGNHNANKILECQNKGAITIKNDSAKLMTYHVGGVSGYLGGIIEDSSNLGSIELTQGTMNIVNKSQVPELGGIAGKGYTGAHVEFCYNLGHLTSNAETTVLAGLVAEAYSTSILNSYHVGTIESQCTTSNLFINGIAHFFQSDGTYKIENVYAAGKVITVPSGKTRKNDDVYGISGNAMNPEYIHNAYYDKNVMGAVISVVPDFGDGSWDKDTVKGLSNLEMTGKDALNNIKFSSFEENWIVPDDHIEKDNNYRYYPLLKRSYEETVKKPIGMKYYRVIFGERHRDISLNIVDGYEKSGAVKEGENYQFIATLPNIYNANQLIIKDNGTTIPVVDVNKGLYEIKDINKDHHITFSIQKSKPTVTFPTEARMNYGETLAQAIYKGQSGKGTFVFKDSDRKLSVKEGQKTYTMIFTPENTYQFETVEQEVKVYVDPIQTTLPETIYLDYQENLTLKDVELPEQWHWKENNQVVQIGEQEFLANYHDKEGNYKEETDIKVKVIMKEQNGKPEIIMPDTPDDSNQQLSGSKEPNNEMTGNKVTSEDIVSVLPYLGLLSLSLLGVSIYYKRKKHNQ